MKSNSITFRAVLLGMLASGLFAWYTVIMENVTSGRQRILTATQIPVLPFLLLMLLVAILNPLLRRLRVVRVLSRSEIMLVFIMTMVSSGLSTFGLASQLVPVVSGLFNRSWNTAQSRWDRHIEPFVNESWFLAEPGIRAHAVAARMAEDTWRETDLQLRAARGVVAVRGTVAALESGLQSPDGKGTAILARLERQYAAERVRLNEVEARWDTLRPPDTGLDVVLQEWPGRVAALRDAYERERALLADLESMALAKVDRFRRGLPEPLRAVPGILPAGGEPFSVYLARLHRMRAGLRATGDLAAARQSIAEARMAQGMAAARRALARFEGSSQTDDLLAWRDDLTNRRLAIDPLLAAARQDVQDYLARRRMADTAELDELGRMLRQSEADVERLVAELQSIERELGDVVVPRLRLAQEAGSVTIALESIIERWERGDSPASLDEDLVRAEALIGELNISWRSFVVGDVPWGDWFGPLARWSLLALAVYVMLMSFNALIFRQWAHHEKLSYPLAELPLMLGGQADDEDRSLSDAGRVPSIYRAGVFWAGFAISALTMGWNIMATRQIVPGINPIPIRFLWSPYIEDSIFSGLLPNAHHQIFFTMIGIAFLIPARISKSLWGFHLVYIGLLLVLVWLGFGENERSFPSTLTMVMNFRSGIGGGALIAFSVFTLWTCRRYLLCAAMPGVLSGLHEAERRELRISSFLFLLSSVLVIGIVAFGMGANLWFTVFCYLVVMVMTIGMMRGVAEGGLLVFQSHFTPFHVIRSTVGMHRPWTSVSLFAPLAAFYYVFFWDLKTFIAPAMANAFKIRDNLGLHRLGFHASVWLSILVASVTAVLTHIIIGYQRGANTMHTWFYSGGPPQLFGSITEMAVTNPVDRAGGGYWMLAGIVIMTILLLVRQRKFGLWHPIGLVMWIHPGMWVLWFSIFLGWVFKTLVGRYGDRSTYHRFRIFFIGLIAGELLMCLFGVDLNRH